MIVEPFEEGGSGGRSGYRVRQDVFGRPPFFTPTAPGSTCLHNPAFNDVICDDDNGGRSATLVAGDDDDTMLAEEHINGQNGQCEPNPLPPNLPNLPDTIVVTLQVALGASQDRLVVTEEPLACNLPEQLPRVPFFWRWRLDASGGADRDVMSGGSRDDVLRGQEDADTLSGLGGADALLGAQGNDALEGGSGNDRLDDGPGDDRARGDDGDDVLVGRGRGRRLHRQRRERHIDCASRRRACG